MRLVRRTLVGFMVAALITGITAGTSLAAPKDLVGDGACTLAGSVTASWKNDGVTEVWLDLYDAGSYVSRVKVTPAHPKAHHGSISADASAFTFDVVQVYFWYGPVPAGDGGSTALNVEADCT